MTSSTREFKRARPALGTLVSISLSGAIDEDYAFFTMSRAFEELDRLEAVFSFFRCDSELSRLNAREIQQMSPELQAVVDFAIEIEAHSSHAFSPYVDSSRRHLDLSGIAKGAIADHVIASMRLVEGVVGCVNAGGDMRFSSAETRQISLRLGSWQRPVARVVSCGFAAVAVSSPTISLRDECSRTRYRLSLRPGLEPDDSAVVSAPSCMIADALTKVALFADPRVIEDCAGRYGAWVLSFDGNGQLQESFGDR